MSVDASSPVRKNIDEVITEVVVEEIDDEKELLQIYSQGSEKSNERESCNSPNMQKQSNKPTTQYNPFLKKPVSIDSKKNENENGEKAQVTKATVQKGRIPSEMFAKYPSDKELKIKESQPVETKQVISEISKVSDASPKTKTDTKAKENLNTDTTDHEEEKVG